MSENPSFTVTYFDKRGAVVGQRVFTCPGYWEACGLGWDHIPAKGDDFQVEEVTFNQEGPYDGITLDDAAILAKAVDILQKRKASAAS